MFSYQLKIPKERVAVLIGEGGSTKRVIEKETKSIIEVDSHEGDVTVSGDEPLLLYSAQLIIKAIARGFNPEIALRLLKQDYAFEIINLHDYNPKQNHQVRLKGRVIGQGGKSRRVIEELAECNISVYGKTISIISSMDTMPLAKHSVESLLKGANHSTVYKWLERKRRDLRFERSLGREP